MRRKAILIGVDRCEGESELDGVRNDIKLFKSYLNRNEFGAWDDNEIVVLENKSRAEILERIREYSNFDYVMLLAAGHGAVRESYGFDTLLKTGKKEYISCEDLKIHCDRQTIIMDVCRNIYYDLNKSLKMDDYLNIVAESMAVNNRSDYKKYFNEKLLEAAKGVFVFYSCNKGEYASDRPSYTQFLLQAGLIESTKSILKTHNYAKEKMKSCGLMQNPQSDTGRTLEKGTPIFSIFLP